MIENEAVNLQPSENRNKKDDHATNRAKYFIPQKKLSNLFSHALYVFFLEWDLGKRFSVAVPKGNEKKLDKLKNYVHFLTSSTIEGGS